MSEHYYTQNPTSRHDVKRLNITLDGKVLSFDTDAGVFSRGELLTQVWGVDYLGESRTVDMHIKTLRQKLGDAGKRIETVIGVGYRMEGRK